MKVLWIVLAAAGGLLLLLFAGLLGASRRVFGRGRPYDVFRHLRKHPELADKIRADRETLKRRGAEEVSVTSYDGLRLTGRLYFTESAPPRGVVLCMHGYHSGAAEDFAGAVQYFCGNGFHVLLVTQRSHGNSEGKRITFGVKERFDCRSWCEYLAERFGEAFPIVTDGVSMGAATVVMATGREVGLPKNVRAIIADCGYTSPWEIVCEEGRRRYHLPMPVLWLFRLAVRLDAGFDLCAASAEKAAAESEIPIFFAHGTGDRLVPCEMGRRNHLACRAESRFFTVEGAGHGLSFVVDREGYERACMAFLEKQLGERKDERDREHPAEEDGRAAESA